MLPVERERGLFDPMGPIVFSRWLKQWWPEAGWPVTELHPVRWGGGMNYVELQAGAKMGSKGIALINTGLRGHEG